MNLRFKLVWILFSLFTLGLCYASDAGYFPSSNHKTFPDLYEEKLKELKQKFLAIEFKEKWEGEFYRGDLLGDNELIIIGNNYFIYSGWGCIPPANEQYGEVKHEKDVIILKFAPPDNREWLMIKVLWGDNRHLVPADRITDFCNTINSGIDLGGLFLHRDDTWSSSGTPNLAKQFKNCLLPTPLNGKVISILAHPNDNDPFYNRTKVLFDIGSNQKAFEGMYLSGISRESTSFAWAILDKCDSETCTALVHQVGTEEIEILPLQIGSEFTSAPFNWNHK